ncbi:hypothetical protein ID0576_14540 [Helicobacter pylori]
MKIVGLRAMGIPMVARLRIVVDMSAIAPLFFSEKLMLKDIRLASNEAGRAIQLPFLFKVQELYSQAEKSGLGALDITAVYHYLEKGDH